MTVHAWRHPKPQGAAGRCIGAGTDLPVDRRKAKRLAHRIRGHARRHQLPRCVYTSPLRRCLDVGRWLARWGWRHHVEPNLREMHFGCWDGLAWTQVSRAEVDAWVADFVHHAPGGHECLGDVLARARTARSTLPADALLVTHGGWLSAASWVWADTAAPTAAGWPRAVGYGQCLPLSG